MESLNCDLCNSKTNNMNSFSCNHRACNNCFYKLCLINKSIIETYTYDTIKELELKCFFCSSGTFKASKGLISQKLKEIPEKGQKDEEVICRWHNKESNIYCSECRAQMCADCFSSHKALPMFEFHKQRECPNIRSHFLNNTCCLHDDLLYHYLCLTCNCTLCEICKLAHDTEHRTAYLQEFYNKKKNEYRSQFVLPPFSAEEISRQIDFSDLELKEEMNKEVANLKNKINSIQDYLNEICLQLDEELNTIYEEIHTNNTINKILFKNLSKDLDNISKSPEFDRNCLYLEKVSKLNNLHKRNLKNDIITEAINSIIKSIDEYKIKINNKSILEICNKENEILPNDFLIDLNKPILQKEEDYSMTSTYSLAGHTSNIPLLIQLQDGRLASGSCDKTIKMWNPQENFKYIHNLTEHTSDISCLIQLQDERLASGSDELIKIWNPHDYFNCTHTLTGHTSDITILVLLQDGRLASGSRDKTIKIWDPQDNFRSIHSLTGHTDAISCLIELLDGKLASGSDKSIKIWNPHDNFDCTHTLTGHTWAITCLIQLQDEKLASGSYDATIKIWNHQDNFECSHTLTDHSNRITNLIQLQDERLASGSWDGAIKIWDPQDNFICTHTLTGHTHFIYSLIQLQDGRLASGSVDETIRMWDPQDNFECTHTLSGHTDSIYILIQLQDGRLASGSWDETIKIWDPQDNINCTHTLIGHTSDISCPIQLQD